jgi:hypothetical protein
MTGPPKRKSPDANPGSNTDQPQTTSLHSRCQRRSVLYETPLAKWWQRRRIELRGCCVCGIAIKNENLAGYSGRSALSGQLYCPALRRCRRLFVTGKVMTTRKKALQPLTPSLQEQSAVLIMDRLPRSILEKYSRDQVRQLYEFLHNGNPPTATSLVSKVKVPPNPFTNTPTDSNGSRFQNRLTGRSVP